MEQHAFFKWNAPNIITISRLLMIPLFVFFFYYPAPYHYLISAFLLAIAAATDWLDGYLARKHNQITQFGAFLDPVADKIIVVVALVLLAEKFSALWFSLPAIVIIMREVVISALREWMAELGKRNAVAVSYVGKVKTSFQLSALVILLAFPAFPEPWNNYLMWLGIAVFYIATLLTIYSMLIYLKAAFNQQA